MNEDMKFQREIEHVRKLFSMEKFVSAFKYCEILESQVSQRGDILSIIQVQEFFLDCLIEVENKMYFDDWISLRNRHLDKLFENYLLIGNKVGAADALLWKVGIKERAGDREILDKLISLFSNETNHEIRRRVQ